MAGRADRRCAISRVSPSAGSISWRLVVRIRFTCAAGQVAEQVFQRIELPILVCLFCALCSAFCVLRLPLLAYVLLPATSLYLDHGSCSQTR